MSQGLNVVFPKELFGGDRIALGVDDGDSMLSQAGVLNGFDAFHAFLKIGRFPLEIFHSMENDDLVVVGRNVDASDSFVQTRNALADLDGFSSEVALRV